MKQLVKTYEFGTGVLLHEEEIDVPDPIPTAVDLLKEEIKLLKDRVDKLEKK